MVKDVWIVKRLLGLVLAILLVAGWTALPSRSAGASSGCVKSIEPAHAREPHDVAAWAQGRPVVGEGSLWTIRSAVSVHPVQYGTGWHLKFPWYTRPNGLPAYRWTPTRWARHISFRRQSCLGYPRGFQHLNARFLGSGMLASHRPVQNLKLTVQSERRARISAECYPTSLGIRVLRSALVVKAFEVIENRHAGHGAVLKTLRSRSSHSRVAKKLSAIALSKQSPTDRIERVTRAALQALAKSYLVY